jgi:hypothetical protein
VAANKTGSACEENFHDRARGLCQVSMNRPNRRQVLDCASPLALFESWPAIRKRQGTAAIQDAIALDASAFRSMVTMRARFLDWTL